MGGCGECHKRPRSSLAGASVTMLGARLTSAGQWFSASAQSGRSSGVEHNLAKVGVEGSNPFARSSLSSSIKQRQWAVLDHSTVITLCLLFALGAALYSSVGHGGASAYIAAMALFSVAPETMKSTALALNLLVAGFGTWRYARRGLTNWKLVLAFALTATPAAFIGGGIHLPPVYYKPLVGILLWAAAARLLWQPKALAERATEPPPLWVSLPAGAVLGLLAGLTGTGGGIFLSPLIILNAWEKPRHTSGVVAAFILLNSIAGLAGNVSSVGHLPSELPLFLASVAGGALVGTSLGVDRLPRPWLLRALGLVLVVAGAKLLFT